MYNRYIPSGASYTRIPVSEPEDAAETGRGGQNSAPAGGPGGFSPAGLPSGEGGGLARLLGALKLEKLDSGDILLLLIVLLLLLEGDDLELVIALGLVLILGLDDEP